ncbi:hypothetical protein ACPA54_01095 [Uniformispora flossi]|uniref:hypothetical protein n=1 Tax=Uniformispora flossi TaxID=3390723 RepID=UPI003C2EC0F9
MSTAEATRTLRPTAPEADPPTQWTTWWNLAFVALPVALLAFLGWRHRALTDDGTIFLRTVRQILAGNGPVLNAGERVEANTSTLWQWLLAFLGWILPGDIGFTAVVTGLVLTTAGVALACDATRRLHARRAGRQVPLAPAGILVLLALPPFWDFSTAGLDSGLGTFWLAGCWWLFVRDADPARHGAGGLPAAAWYGAGFLVRPELAVVTAVFLTGAWLLQRPSWRRTAAWLAVAGAGSVAYEIFRAGYYGLLTPMPALTKEAGETELGLGWRYGADFVTPYFLYIPLTVLAVAGVVFFRCAGTRDRIVTGTPVVAAALLAAYVVKVGGDYMHARMLLPPLFLALLPVLVVRATRSLATVSPAVAVWAVACIGPWHPSAFTPTAGAAGAKTVVVRTSDIGITGTLNADHTDDWLRAFPELRAAIAQGMASPQPVLLHLRPGDYGFESTVPLNPAYAHAQVSVPGWYLGVTGAAVPLDQRIVEMWGLANTVGAHLEYPDDWREYWPGHRKLIDDVWLLALELDPRVTEPPPGYPKVTAAGLAAARHALSCGDLKELLDSTREPLTWKRFWSNLTGAASRTSLRIPRDPIAAEARFC